MCSWFSQGPRGKPLIQVLWASEEGLGRAMNLAMPMVKEKTRLSDEFRGRESECVF